ncbi:MAG: hypothetical protein C0446_14490, partial [Chitinophaga sp.]|nr:hypothetical protein [Chitinophaga sp.]
MQSEQLVKTWICDSCGQLIQKPEDGWVEWIVSVPENKAYDLRLVHRTGSGLNGRSCQYQQAAVRQKYEGIIADSAL